MDYTEFENIKISYDAIDTGNQVNISNRLSNILHNLFEQIQNPGSGTIKKIRKHIKEYPENLQLKNYLVSVYQILGRETEAKKINNLILKTNPDYFFAQMQKANWLIDEGKYEEATEITGIEFNLKTIYPDRDIFHISEFMSMQNVAVKYYTGQKEYDKAHYHLEKMREADSDSIQYKNTYMFFTASRMISIQKRWEDESKMRSKPINNFKPKEYKLTKFNFEQTKWLYEYQFDFPEDLLNEYLNLEKSKLIEDLENVLKDCTYNFYKDKDYTKTFAAIHACFMLAELESQESLSLILEMMRQNEEFYEETFGDILLDKGWIVLFKLGKNNLPALTQFAKEPGIYAYFKIVIIDTLVQIVHYHPEKRTEIVKIFEDLLNFFINSEIEDNVLDTDFISLFISDLIKLKLSEFLPKIKDLYDKKLVIPGICGDYDEIEKDINNPHSHISVKRDLLTIMEIYESYQQSDDYQSDEKFSPFSDYEESYPFSDYEQNVPVKKQNKTGRNDPCPCGSGKKFKKCCLGKGIYD